MDAVGFSIDEPGAMLPNFFSVIWMLVVGTSGSTDFFAGEESTVAVATTREVALDFALLLARATRLAASLFSIACLGLMILRGLTMGLVLAFVRVDGGVGLCVGAALSDVITSANLYHKQKENN